VVQVWTDLICFDTMVTFVLQAGHLSTLTVTRVVPWPGFVPICSWMVSGTLQSEHMGWTVNALV
jgi:hypothetical protein